VIIDERGVSMASVELKSDSPRSDASCLLWVGVIGARAAFSYGSTHWFGPQISHWMILNAVSRAAITDALIFMAVTMMVTRTLGLLFDTLRLGSSTQSVVGTPRAVAVSDIAL
jgi:hypothetical protein